MLRTDLTETERRVLAFLARWPRLYTIMEMRLHIMLRQDDTLCIPSLFAKKLVSYRATEYFVQASPEGRAVARPWGMIHGR